MEQFAHSVIDFVKAHDQWVVPIAFLLAFGESLAFISLILPSTVILVAMGGLLGASGIDFFPVWIAAGVGGALGYAVSYWRTASQLEVDFILADHEVAVEVKGTQRTETHHLRGLRAVGEEYRFRRRILVSCDPRRRSAEGGIEIIPWREFLEQLWSGGIMS